MAVNNGNWIDKYTYPNTNVLINKFNIMDYDKLHEMERKISTLAGSQINEKGIKGNFDLKHLQAIHKALFSDIYNWAGEIRSIDIAKSNLFCRAQFINSYAESVFGELKEDKYLVGMNKERAIRKLASYMGDINALHPFREGNGRTQRHFIKQLAKATGIELKLCKVDSDRMMSASLASFQGDSKQFEAIFNEVAEPMSLQEQEAFLKSVSKVAYKEFLEQKKEGLLPDRVMEFAEINNERIQVEQSKSGMSLNEWKEAMNRNNSSNVMGYNKEHEMEIESAESEKE